MNLFLKQPTALFGLPTRDTGKLSHLEDYITEVASVLERAAWDDDILELLELLPQIFLRLEDKVELGEQALPVLLRHLHVVWQAYQKTKNPQLEELLQLSPEYSYHLLHWAQGQREWPLACTAEKLREAMLLDPYWAIRWQQRAPHPLYYERILAFARHTCHFNPRAAWLLHQLAASGKDRSLALGRLLDELPLFMTDPRLCFMILDTYPEADRSPLFRSAFGHPDCLLAWACRFPGEFDKIIQRELLRRPAWLVEYVARCQPPNGREILEEARGRCKNRWVQPWLELYLQETAMN